MFNACVHAERIQPLMPAGRLWIKRKGSSRGQWLSHIFPVKSLRSIGHCIFCAAKKRQTNYVLALVSSHRYGCTDMECYKIFSWRPFSIHRFYQFHYTRNYVHILFGSIDQSSVQKQSLVEKIHYNCANGNCNLILQRKQGNKEC